MIDSDAPRDSPAVHRAKVWRPRFVSLGTVLALHVAALVVLDRPRPRDAWPPSTPQRLTLRLIDPEVHRAMSPPPARQGANPNATTATAATTAAAAAPESARRRPAALPRPARTDAEIAPPQPITRPPPAALAETAMAPAPPAMAEPAASAADAAASGSILDTEASRRAIRASARTASLTAEVSRVAGGRPVPDTSVRLGSAIQSAGRGDCAKGEYAGGGMGLLSLPFLAAAAAQGHCAK